MSIRHPLRLRERENSVDEGLEKGEDRQREFANAERSDTNEVGYAGNELLPPKCYMSSPDVQEESKLDKSAIEELYLLSGSNPTDGHIQSSSKTLQGMGIRRSQSFDRQKIELSLSSDYVDQDYSNSTLKRAIEQMARRVESGLMRERGKEKEVQFYVKKTGELEERCRELHRLVEVLDMRVEELQGKVREREGEVRSKEEEFSKIRERDRKEMEELRVAFEKAKQVGQRQIDHLLSELTLKQQQIAALQSNTLPYTSTTLAEHKPHFFSLNSPYSIVSSAAAVDSSQPTQRSDYLTRFFRFANTLDRKLTRSCCKTSQQIYENPSAAMRKSPEVFPVYTDSQTHLQTLQTHNTRLLRLLDHNQTITQQLRSVHQQLLS